MKKLNNQKWLMDMKKWIDDNPVLWFLPEDTEDQSRINKLCLLMRRAVKIISEKK